MKKTDPIIMGLVFIAMVVIGGIILGAIGSEKESASTETYQITDSEKPELEISEKSFDFGRMKLSEIKTKEIILKNVGNRPLTLKNFSTSCDCTYAEVVVAGEKSPRFSMHYSKSWQKDLSPGQTAALNISYEPSIMPVQGEVSRVVYFITNDPANLQVEIDFKAYVE